MKLGAAFPQSEIVGSGAVREYARGLEALVFDYMEVGGHNVLVQGHATVDAHLRALQGFEREARRAGLA